MAGVIRTLLNPPAGFKPPVQPKVPGNLTIPPNYGSLITSDPNYVGGEAALQTGLGHAGAARDEQIARAQGLYTDKNNPHSILNQLQQAYQHNVSSTHANLEERGILNSGATSEADNRLGNDYSLANYNAGNDFNTLVSNALQGYQQANDTYGTAHAQLISDVSNTLKQDPTITSTTAHLVQGSKARYGKNVYAGPGGQLFTQDGKPFTPPPVGVSPAVRAISNPLGVL